jgi:pSer/pThr/pTyr-binding forkhead associated (FHA) protein
MSVRCSLGHENPDGSAFCDECGEPLNAAAPVSAPVQVATQAPEPVQPDPSFAVAPEPDPTPAPVTQQPDFDAATQVAPADTTQAPANALQARLIVEADNQEFDLSGKDNILIGREDAVSNIYPDVDLTEHGGEDGGVSRLHARIFYENGQYMLEDENSTNFTFLNRQRLAAKTPTPLNDNDEVRLGRVLLRFKTS